MAIDLVNMCCEYIAYTSDGSFPSPEWGKFTNYTIATFSLPKYVKNDQGEHLDSMWTLSDLKKICHRLIRPELMEWYIHKLGTAAVGCKL